MCRRKKKIRHFNGVNNRKRPNGNGTLEWLGERGWLARWTVRDLSGRKFRKSQMIRKSEEVPDVESARKVLNDLTRTNNFQNIELALLRTKQQLEGIRAERQKYIDSLPCLELDDLWDIYTSLRMSRKASDSTKRMYECQVGRFVSWMKETYPDVKELRHVTRKMARNFSDYLIRTVSGNTHNKYMTLLSSIFDGLKAKEEEESDGVQEYNGVIDVGEKRKANLTLNPFSHVGRVVSIPCRRRELSEAEIRNLLNTADGNWKTLTVILLTTGLRLKDAVLLSFDSVQLEEGLIKIRPFKVAHRMALKNEWTYIPILPDLRNILLSISEEERHGYVMKDLANMYLSSPTNFNYHLTKIFRRAGLENEEVGAHGRHAATISAHYLRHTFASMLQRCLSSSSGKSNALGIVSSLLSHHSLGMTQRYVHQSPEDLKAQMQNFPRLFGT